MSRPVAVCISDLHFNVNNLDLSTIALKDAIQTATELEVPLIIAGDLHDTKAIIRAEVANRLIEILSLALCPISVLVGNHDLANEKGAEHGLNYLEPYAEIVSTIATYQDSKTGVSITSIPYQTDSEKLKEILLQVPKGSQLIMHQGFQGANLGDYVQDKTSISPEFVKNFHVISGHYHRHQTIGTITYIGSPFTMSFGEANDGDKGYLVLNQDGSFTRKILELRRHRVLEFNYKDLQSVDWPTAYWGFAKSNDLVWVKIKGPFSELKKLSKQDIGASLLGHSNFKLDLIADEPTLTPLIEVSKFTDAEILDKIIQSLNETDVQKSYLKELWRETI